MSRLLKDDCSSSTDQYKRPRRRRKHKKTAPSHSSHCISSIDITWKNDDDQPKIKVKYKEKFAPSFPEDDRADDQLLLEDSTNNIVNYLVPDEEDICFGQIQSNIVGVRYYKGTVSNKEMVLLVREPNNKFDPNAVRVLNMAAQQVGHIVRQHAAALAIIMDNLLARVEGTIPYGATNSFQIPVDIHFWGSPVNKDEVLRVIESHNVPLGRRQGLSRKKQGNHRVMSSRSFVSPQQMQNELDKIFETLDEGDKITETEPCDAVATVLYPHQKQALSWMMGKENTDTLPPFWEYRNGGYFNTLTMFTSNVKPSSVHGGILADDMGLGKTLEMISLILSNFVDGKPIAYPMPGTRRLSFGYENMIFTKKSATSHLDLQQTSSKAKTYSCLKSPSEVKPNTGSHSSPRLIISKKASLCGNHYCDKSSHVDVDRITAAPRPRDKRTVKRSAQYVYDDDIIDVDDDTDNLPRKTDKLPRKTDKLPRKTDKLHRKKDTQEYHPGASTANNEINTDFGHEDDIIDLTVEDDELPDVSPSTSKMFEVEDDELPDVSPSTSKMFEVEEDELPDISSSTSKNFEVALPPNCESTTGRTLTHGPRTTLIICPLSVVSNWLDQFEVHVRKTVHILLHVYYGPNRTKDVSFLKNQDVVITTYSTLASDFKMGETRSPLHKVEWLRIVLDEGHIIRNNSAQQTKAVFELKAERKWVLTGTPIQNSIKDFWSILNFLKVHPFTDTTWWNRTIAKPVYRREESAIPRVAHLMRNLAMRRTKNQKYNGEPLVALPARRVYLEKITLTEHEREVYDTMQTKGQTLIGRYFENETLLRNYGQVLAILMRLRQLCCHPQLIAKALVKDNDSEEVNDTTKKKLIDQLMAVLSSGSDEECSICLESLNQAVITPCAHVYCRSCIEAVLKTKKSEQCPLCRGDIEKNQLIEVPKEQMDKPDMVSNWQSSSKVDALMQALKALRQEDRGLKSIVVSQFTSLLTLLEKPLAMEGFVYSRFDGSMNVAERTEVLRNFSQSHAGSPTVLLLSLKAGGVGLNLTAASRVFLMDPAWNPASEDQCFDRCHRLGQTKDVIITKFVIEDSIEERMLELQEKKRQLMHNAFDKKISAEQNRTNRINDIKNLISYK